MRDFGKIKDHFEFSFDSRQLGLVLLAGVFAAALVFVLGVSVGMQWERKKGREAALSAQVPAAAPAIARQKPAPAPAPPEPAPQPVQVAPSPAPPVPPPPAEVKPAPMPQPPPEPPAQAAPKRAHGAVDKPKPDAPDLTFPKALTSNDKKVTPMKPVGEKEKDKDKKDAPPVYTAQVGAYSSRAEARELVDSLVKKGFPARIYEEKSGGKTVYKARVGRYASKDEAKKTMGRLESSEGLKPYLTREGRR